MLSKTRDNTYIGPLTTSSQVLETWGGASGSTATYSLPLHLSRTAERLSCTNGRHRWNECSHTSVSEWINQDGRFVYSALAGTPLGAKGVTWSAPVVSKTVRSGIVTYQGDLDVLGSVVEDDELSQAASAAYASVLPTVDNVLGESLANAIIDSPKTFKLSSDVRDLLVKLRGVSRGIRASRHLRVKGKVLGSQWLASASLKQLATTLAQGNLLYQYGIKTLWSDIKGLAQVSREISGLVDQIYRFNGTKRKTSVTKSAQVRDVDDTVVASGTYTSMGVYQGENQTVARRSSSSAHVTLHLLWKCELPQYSKWLATTLAFLDAVGLNANPRIIWDALKYSFVVDWFARVGDHLDTYRQEWLRPTVTIYDLWETRSIKATDKLFYEYGYLGGSGSLLVAKRSSETYQRRRSSPIVWRGIETSSLNAYKVVMAASLGGARVRSIRL